MRPLWVMVMKPSSMSMLGVPYSPIVPSFTRWQSGLNSCACQRSAPHALRHAAAHTVAAWADCGGALGSCPELTGSSDRDPCVCANAHMSSRRMKGLTTERRRE